MRQFVKILLNLTAVLVLSCSYLTADPAADEPVLVRNLVGQLSDHLTADRLQVRIGPLTLAGTRLSSRFADHLLTMIRMEMTQPQYQSDFVSIEKVLVDRASLTRGLLPGNDTRGSLEAIGSIESQSATEALLTGTYQENKALSAVLVVLKLEDVTGKTISAAEAFIKRDAITLPMEPANKSEMIKAEQDLDRLSRPKNDFRVQLWIDKGNGGIYKHREELKLYFRTETACYLKVLYIDAGGNKILMYPTERDQNIRLEAGEIHELHRNNLYTILPPFGSELMIAFASIEPFSSDTEIPNPGGYRSFDHSESAAIIAERLRGLGISKRPIKGSYSEARVFLTSVE